MYIYIKIERSECMERENRAWSDLVGSDQNYSYVEANTYEIKSLPQLYSNASEIRTYPTELKNIIESLNSFIASIQANWQNEQGEDVKSAIAAINKIIESLETNIMPLYGEIANQQEKLGRDTERIQATTYAINRGQAVPNAGPKMEMY